MLAATIACVVFAFAAEAAPQDASEQDADSMQFAEVNTIRLLDAIDLAPVRYGMRGPGPTRFGMHYWVDPDLSNNPHGVHFVVVAVFADPVAAREHYDRLRTRAGHPPLTVEEAAADRFAVRFNAGADATDVTLTRGNVYTAFRAVGEQGEVAALGRQLVEAMGDPLIAPPGMPGEIPSVTLSHRPGLGERVLVRVHMEGAPDEPRPRFVLFRPDGEYIAIADAEGIAEVDLIRFDTIELFEVVAGWEENRWHRWLIPKAEIVEGSPDD